MVTGGTVYNSLRADEVAGDGGGPGWRVPGDRHGVRQLLLVHRDRRGAGECVFLDYLLA